MRDKFGLLIVIDLVTYHLPPVFLLPRRARQTVTIFIDQCNRMHQSQNSSHFDTDGMEKERKKGTTRYSTLDVCEIWINDNEK